MKINKSRLGGLKRIELYGNPGTVEGRSKGGRKTTSLFRKNPLLAKKRGFIIRKEIKYPEKSLLLAEFRCSCLDKKKLEYQKVCLRGLMDTDGGLYLHSYKSNGRTYTYLKLGFTNCSKPLLLFVFNVLKKLNYKPCLSGNNLSIGSESEVKKYFAEIGTTNPKHLNKFKDYFTN